MSRAPLAVGIGAALTALLTVGTIATWRLRAHDAPETSGAAPVIAVKAFATTSPQLDPWSGAGLAQQVRDMLATAHSEASADASGRRSPTHELHGSIAREGQRLAVSVQLLRSGRSDTVWTGAYWRSEQDLTSLASELARAAVTAARDASERHATVPDSGPGPPP